MKVKFPVEYERAVKNIRPFTKREEARAFLDNDVIDLREFARAVYKRCPAKIRRWLDSACYGLSGEQTLQVVASQTLGKKGAKFLRSQIESLESAVRNEERTVVE